MERVNKLQRIKRTVPKGYSRLKTSKTVTHLSDVIDHHLQPCTNPSSETPNWSILEARKSQELSFNHIEVPTLQWFSGFSVSLKEAKQKRGSSFGSNMHGYKWTSAQWKSYTLILHLLVLEHLWSMYFVISILLLI
jgi:hypothetical protein